MRRFELWPAAIAGVSIGIWFAAGAGCTNRERGTVNASDIYQGACARCHGERGKGGSPAGPGDRGPRDFTDAEWKRSFSSARIQTVVRSGRGSMPSFQGVLTDEEIVAVAEVVLSFGVDR